MIRNENEVTIVVTSPTSNKIMKLSFAWALTAIGSEESG